MHLFSCSKFDSVHMTSDIIVVPVFSFNTGKRKTNILTAWMIVIDDLSFFFCNATSGKNNVHVNILF